MVLCKIVHCQVSNKNNINGSWINISINEYYKSNNQLVCDVNYFDNDKFIPLFLSFENKHQVKLTPRIEQTIFTYEVNYSNPDSIIIYRGRNVYRIYIINDTLKLKYNQNIISFTKVSETFSSDVFGEYVKGIMFKTHQTYSVSFFSDSHSNTNFSMNSSNFNEKIKLLFKCDNVDFVQLGTYKYKNTCLPEIAIYYNNSKKWNYPRILGILIENDKINFIDESGIIVLTIKSN